MIGRVGANVRVVRRDERELRIAAFVAAAIALMTATVHYCPANAVLAIDSCRQAA